MPRGRVGVDSCELMKCEFNVHSAMNHFESVGYIVTTSLYSLSRFHTSTGDYLLWEETGAAEVNTQSLRRDPSSTTCSNLGSNSYIRCNSCGDSNHLCTLTPMS